jgi:hypothetical protein
MERTRFRYGGLADGLRGRKCRWNGFLCDLQFNPEGEHSGLAGRDGAHGNDTPGELLSLWIMDLDEHRELPGAFAARVPDDAVNAQRAD